MKFCTYILYIACYFLYVQFCKSVIFVRTFFAHFDVLYVQFWRFSHFVRTILPTFYEKYRPNLEVFKGKNGLKTVKNRYYLGFSKYFCTYKKCVFWLFLGCFGLFLPILWPLCPLLYPLLTIYEFYKYICKK